MLYLRCSIRPDVVVVGRVIGALYGPIVRVLVGDPLYYHHPHP